MVDGRASWLRAVLGIIALSMLGCGGVSVSGGDQASTDDNASGGMSGAGSSHASSSGGSVGDATPSGGTPAVTECLAVYPNLELTDCERLGRYASVHDPVVSDANGDGRASPGERITISVTLSEVTGETFIPYPGIDFQALEAGITLDRSGFDGPSSYSLLPCESLGGSVGATLSRALTRGSVVHVTAQAATLNQDCPNGTKLTIPIAIE